MHGFCKIKRKCFFKKWFYYMVSLQINVLWTQACFKRNFLRFNYNYRVYLPLLWLVRNFLAQTCSKQTCQNELIVYNCWVQIYRRATLLGTPTVSSFSFGGPEGIANRIMMNQVSYALVLVFRRNQAALCLAIITC